MSLREFLRECESAGELLTVEEPLSTKFEIPAVLKELDGGPVVVFENVEGHDVRVVGGVCGTRDRVQRAVGAYGEDFHRKLLEAVETPLKAERVEDGAVAEVVEEPRLDRIPVLTHYRGDGGPYMTASIVSALSPDGEVENVSMHRLQVLDERHMAIRIVPRHLYRLCQQAREAGMDHLDVAISVGVHPAVLLASTTPAPFGVSEYDVANRLLGGGLKLVRCRRVEAYAPADAELVIEGRILLDREVVEGPFVDLTGTRDKVRPQPVVEAVGVMHREGYLYQALLPAGSEHRLLMGMPKEALIWEHVRRVVPEVRGVNLTVGGCGWLHCVVSVRKVRDGDGKNVLMAVFSAHPSLKHAVVVDEDVDPFNLQEVEWAIATRFRGDRDLVVVKNAAVSTLDPTAGPEGLGCKVGVDATKPVKGDEGFLRAEIPVSDRVRRVLEELRAG